MTKKADKQARSAEGPSFTVKDPFKEPDVRPGFFAQRAAEQEQQARRIDPADAGWWSDLAAALSSPDWGARREAAVALARVGEREGLKLLGDALAGQDLGFQQQIHNLLKRPPGQALAGQDAQLQKQMHEVLQRQPHDVTADQDIERRCDAVVAVGRVMLDDSEAEVLDGIPNDAGLVLTMALDADKAPEARAVTAQALRAVPGAVPGGTPPVRLLAGRTVLRLLEAARAGRIAITEAQRQELEQAARQIEQ